MIYLTKLKFDLAAYVRYHSLAAGNPSGSRLECMYVRSKSTPFRNVWAKISEDINLMVDKGELPESDRRTWKAHRAKYYSKCLAPYKSRYMYRLFEHSAWWP